LNGFLDYIKSIPIELLMKSFSCIFISGTRKNVP